MIILFGCNTYVIHKKTLVSVIYLILNFNVTFFSSIIPTISQEKQAVYSKTFPSYSVTFCGQKCVLRGMFLGYDSNAYYRAESNKQVSPQLRLGFDWLR